VRATVKGLQERIAWLKAETDKAEKQLAKLMGTGPAVQEEMPGMPAVVEAPRAKSASELYHDEFQSSRRAAFERMRVPFVADKENSVVLINTAMPRIRAACVDDDELFAVFDSFCRDTWAAKCAPPFPFGALISEKLWRKHLDLVRGVVTQRTA